MDCPEPPTMTCVVRQRDACSEAIAPVGRSGVFQVVGLVPPMVRAVLLEQIRCAVREAVPLDEVEFVDASLLTSLRRCADEETRPAQGNGPAESVKASRVLRSQSCDLTPDLDSRSWT